MCPKFGGKRHAEKKSKFLMYSLSFARQLEMRTVGADVHTKEAAALKFDAMRAGRVPELPQILFRENFGNSKGIGPPPIGVVFGLILCKPTLDVRCSSASVPADPIPRG
jgi:hypothetical protein